MVYQSPWARNLQHLDYDAHTAAAVVLQMLNLVYLLPVATTATQIVLLQIVKCLPAALVDSSRACTVSNCNTLVKLVSSVYMCR